MLGSLGTFFFSFLVAISSFLIAYYRIKGDLFVNGKFTKRGFYTLICGIVILISTVVLIWSNTHKAEFDADKRSEEARLQKMDNSLEKEWEPVWNNSIKTPIQSLSFHLYSDVDFDLQFISEVLPQMSLIITQNHFDQKNVYEISVKENKNKDYLKRYDLVLQKNKKNEKFIKGKEINFYIKQSLDTLDMSQKKPMLGTSFNNSFYSFNNDLKWIDPLQKINSFSMYYFMHNKSKFILSDLHNYDFTIKIPKKLDALAKKGMYLSFLNENKKLAFVFDMSNLTLANSHLSQGDVYYYNYSGEALYRIIHTANKKIYKAKGRLESGTLTEEDYECLHSIGLIPMNYNAKSGY